MEGLVERSASKKRVYLYIIDGKIACRLEKHVFNEDGAQVSEEREIKDKQGNLVKIVIERYYEKIFGVIVDAKIEKSDFGYQLRFYFKTNSEHELVLSMSTNSGYARALLYRLPNVDPDNEVMFKPYNFISKDNGKKQQGIAVYQNEEKIISAFTKDEPNGLPPVDVTENEFGEQAYNDKKRMKFLFDKFKDFAAKLKQLNIGEVEAPIVEIEPPAEKAKTKNTTPLEEEEDDDLPF